MFKEIEQGLERYRQKLGEYSSLVGKLKAGYPDGFSRWTSSKDDVRKVEAWNAHLNGMAEALGLNEKEIGDFFAEVGINYQSKAPESEEVDRSPRI